MNLAENDFLGSPQSIQQKSHYLVQHLTSGSEKRQLSREEWEKYRNLFESSNKNQTYLLKSTCVKLPFDVLLTILMAEKDAYIKELVGRLSGSCAQFYKSEELEDFNNYKRDLIRKDAEVVALTNKISGLHAELDDNRETLQKAVCKLEKINEIISEGCHSADLTICSNQSLKQRDQFDTTDGIRKDKSVCKNSCQSVPQPVMNATEIELTRKSSEANSVNLQDVSVENELYRQKLEMMGDLDKQVRKLADEHKRKYERLSQQTIVINMHIKDIKQLQENQEKLEDLVHQLSPYEAKFKTLQKKLDNASIEKKLYQTKSEECIALKEEVTQLRLRIDRLKKELSEAEVDRQKLLTTQFEIERLKEEKREWHIQIESLSKAKSEVSRLKQDLNEKNSKIKLHEQKLNEFSLLQVKMSDMRDELQVCIDQVDFDKGVLKHLQQELNACRELCGNKAGKLSLQKFFNSGSACKEKLNCGKEEALEEKVEEQLGHLVVAFDKKDVNSGEAQNVIQSSKGLITYMLRRVIKQKNKMEDLENSNKEIAGELDCFKQEKEKLENLLNVKNASIQELKKAVENHGELSKELKKLAMATEFFKNLVKETETKCTTQILTREVAENLSKFQKEALNLSKKEIGVLKHQICGLAGISKKLREKNDVLSLALKVSNALHVHTQYVRCGALRHQVELLLKEIETLKNEKSEFQIKCDDLEIELVKTKSFAEGVTKELDQCRVDNCNLKDVINNLKISAATDKERMQALEDELRIMIEDLHGKTKDLEEIVAEKDQEIGQLKGEPSGLKNEIRKLNSEVEVLRNRCNDWEAATVSKADFHRVLNEKLLAEENCRNLQGIGNALRAERDEAARLLIDFEKAKEKDGKEKIVEELFQLEENIRCLKLENTNLKEEIIKLEKMAGEWKAVHLKMIDEHAKNVVEIKNQHVNEINALIEKNSEKVRKLSEQSEKESKYWEKLLNENINNTKAKYESDIRKLTERHKASILRLQALHEDELQDLNTSYETQMESMQTQNEKIIADLTERFKDQHKQDVKELENKFQLLLQEKKTEHMFNMSNLQVNMTQDVENSAAKLQAKYSGEIKRLKKKMEVVKCKYEDLILEERKKYEEQLQTMLSRIRKGQTGDQTRFPISTSSDAANSTTFIELKEVLENVANQRLDSLTLDDLILVQSKSCILLDKLNQVEKNGNDAPLLKANAERKHMICDEQAGKGWKKHEDIERAISTMRMARSDPAVNFTHQPKTRNVIEKPDVFRMEKS